MTDEHERRRFPRLHAAAFFRPSGVRTMVQDWQNRVRDVSLGGLRIYSDDPVAVGDALDLDVYHAGETFTVTAKVMWVDKLPTDAPARFDIGLAFVKLSDEARERLRTILVS